MDFSVGGVISGLLLGIIGAALFVYGKRETNIKCLAAGAAMCVFPYFVTSIMLSWAIAGACLGVLYWTSRNSG